MSDQSMQLAIQFRSIGDGTVPRAVQYCHDLEIDRLVIPWASVPGYDETEELDGDAMDAMRSEMEAEGITFSTMIMRPDLSMITGEPEGEAHWQRLRRNLEVMGAHGGETLITFITRDRPEDESRLEEGWERLFAFYRKFMDKAEAGGVRVALHPVAETEDRLKRDLVTDYDSMKKLLDAVPSAANGVCMCLGNFWLSAGDEIYDQIRGLGDKIFAVHVRATKRGLGETPFWLGTGGPDYAEVMQALRDINYHGELIPEHLPDIVGENRHDAGTAWVMGYMKAMLEVY